MHAHKTLNFLVENAPDLPKYVAVCIQPPHPPVFETLFVSQKPGDDPTSNLPLFSKCDIIICITHTLIRHYVEHPKLGRVSTSRGGAEVNLPPKML